MRRAEQVRVRQNRGKHKLLACVPCEICHETLYPDSVELKSYRVREVSAGFLQAPAFYYSHVTCGKESFA